MSFAFRATAGPLVPSVLVVALTACNDPPRRPARNAAPPALPAVACWAQPYPREVYVTCRYYAPAQMAEVWERSVKQASVLAVSQGFTHLQWVSLDQRPETAPGPKFPVRCRRSGWNIEFNCTGGDQLQLVVAFDAFTRFALLTTDEAAARANDPLIPRERHPLDARAAAAQP